MTALIWTPFQYYNVQTSLEVLILVVSKEKNYDSISRLSKHFQRFENLLLSLGDHNASSEATFLVLFLVLSVSFNIKRAMRRYYDLK